MGIRLQDFFMFLRLRLSEVIVEIRFIWDRAQFLKDCGPTRKLLLFGNGTVTYLIVKIKFIQFNFNQILDL